jgi:hypothetical protein
LVTPHNAAPPWPLINRQQDAALSSDGWRFAMLRAGGTQHGLQLARLPAAVKFGLQALLAGDNQIMATVGTGQHSCHGSA